MKKFIFILWLLTINQIAAQIKGQITDEKGNPLPYVNIYIENTYPGTTSNLDGKFEIYVNDTTKGVLVFQFLGFKTQKIPYVSSQIASVKPALRMRMQ
jgi:hypothetical protein